MAEGGQQCGCRHGQPLELNWAGCDMYGRDLFDLDEADSELLNIETYSYEVERDFFPDVNINRELDEGLQFGWGVATEPQFQLQRIVPKDTLSKGSTSRSPKYPPTLLELEVQALAKIGVLKLYHDSRDLEDEEIRAEEERKLAIINRFDRERQALSPLPSQQQVQALEREDFLESEEVAFSSKESSVQSASTSVGMDLLELQKVALSRMNGAQKSSSDASASSPSPSQSSTNSDLLELQNAALSSIKSTSQPLSLAKSLNSNTEGDLLELQKVALASMKKLTQVLHSHSPTQVSSSPSSVRGDFLELQRATPSNMQNPQFQTFSSHVVFAFQTTPPSAESPGASCSSKPRKYDHKGNQKGQFQVPLQPCSCLLKQRKVNHESDLKIAAIKQEISGGHLLEVQKDPPKGLLEQPFVALTPQVTTHEAGGDLLELQKVALRSISAIPNLASASQQTKNGDLFDPQKNVTHLLESQKIVSSAPTQTKREGDVPKQQESPMTVQSGTTSTQGNQQTGQDPSGLQNIALSTIVACQGGGEKKVAQDLKLKQQNNTEGVVGKLSSSSLVLSTTSSLEPMQRLLQELSSKDQALQSANLIIEERSNLLREYEDSLAHAVILLESMNVQCADLKRQTKNVLTESEGIFQNPSNVCHALENIDCSILQCRKQMHCLNGSSPTIADNSHIHLEMDKRLEVSPGEINECKILVEELLKELRSVEVARKEAQYGCQLQIQKNEQLIAELQTFNVAPIVFNEVLSNHDEDHAKVKQKEIIEDHENDLTNTRCFENTSESKHPSNPPHTSLSNNDVIDNACKDPCEKTTENSCDHVWEGLGNQPIGRFCDHVYKYMEDHIYENPSQNHPKNKMNESSCVPTYESAHDQVKEGSFDQANKASGDHVYESLNDKANEVICDHVYGDPQQLVDQNSYDLAYEGKSGKSPQNQYDLPVCLAVDNPGKKSSENASYNQYDELLSIERCSNHEFDSSCDQIPNETSEYTADQTIEDLHDYAYEDGKDCGLVPAQENIESAIFNSPTWMPPLLYDKQLPLFSNKELGVSADLRLKERAQLHKRSYSNERISSPNALWEHLQHFVTLLPKDLQRHEEHKTTQIGNLEKEINQLQNSLLQEQEKNRNMLNKTDDAHHGPTKTELEDKDKVIRKMHFQIQQLEATMRQEREACTEALEEKNRKTSELNQQVQELHKRLQLMENNGKEISISTTIDTKSLHASLHTKDENIRELQEAIARKEVDWQAEKHHMMKHFNDLETKLLVKEEDNIRLTHELEMLSSSNGFNVKDDIDGSHYFQDQLKEEGREILDLRCEVLSLQDCLGIKTQAIKTMEKELARSYNIVTELRSKLRGLKECERNSHQQGQNMKLIERLRSTEGKLHICQSEKAVLSAKVQDLLARCKYLEELEHLHREGYNDMKAQTINELEKELERNVDIIKNMQTCCSEYEVRAKQAEEELERKDQLLMKAQEDMFNLKKQQTSLSPSTKYQPNDGESSLVVLCEESRLQNPKKDDVSLNTLLEHSKVASPNVNTLRKLLTDQWRIQKVMEDRLNTMMTYVSDRVDEFEQMSSSDATSDSSFVPNPQLNYFHVEAKLMKLQLEQQLQILRGTTLTSLPSSGITSPGQCNQTCLSSQSLQLMVEKNALEDSAQTLQEKTSRLLNKLTTMRTEFGPNSC